MEKQAILNGSYFSLDEKSEMMFRLKDLNWNDNGYYTLYALEVKFPKSDLYYRIANIHIMNIGQRKGEKPLWIPTTPIIYISNVDSAETLLLYLTPEQRSNLEQLLLLRYDTIHVDGESVFLESVLRHKTLSGFIKSQERIKELMRLPLDVSCMIDNHKTQLISFFENRNSPQ